MSLSTICCHGHTDMVYCSCWRNKNVPLGFCSAKAATARLEKYFVQVSKILCTIVQLSTCTNEHVLEREIGLEQQLKTKKVQVLPANQA
jgi:hypothetical protein